MAEVVMNGKLVNRSMLIGLFDDDKPKKIKINQINKAYIDSWVIANYESLFDKFSRNDNKITRRDYSKTDILHDTLLRIYEIRDDFSSKKDCWKFINKKFKMIK